MTASSVWPDIKSTLIPRLAAIIASANGCPPMTGITTSEINGPCVLVESAPAITAVHAGANRTTTDGCDSNKMIFAANVFHGRQF